MTSAEKMLAPVPTTSNMDINISNRQYRCCLQHKVSLPSPAERCSARAPDDSSSSTSCTTAPSSCAGFQFTCSSDEI
jgi:hypothetical protein